MTITADFNLSNKTIQQCYFTIIQEIKDLLKSYPSEYRTYIAINERNVDDHPDITFFNPLFALQLQKADADFYLSFTICTEKETTHQHNQLAITRCILKHTAKETTPINIESRVTQSFEQAETYYTVLKEYHAGMWEYKPQRIESITEEA